MCGRKVQCVVVTADKNTVSGNTTTTTNDNGNDNATDGGGGGTRSTKTKQNTSSRHTHQFGNTSSGIKHNYGDTRTIHIINSNTVKEFSDKIYPNGGGSRSGDGDGDGGGYSLSSTRFRPNIIVDNLAPWAEFDLIGKTIEVVPSASTSATLDSNNDGSPPSTSASSPPSPLSPIRLRIVSRTVRCAGVGVDPLMPPGATIGNDALDIPKLLAKHFPEHGPYLGVYAIVDQESLCAGGGGILCVGDSFRVVDDN